jgi:hypothetical protein
VVAACGITPAGFAVICYKNLLVGFSKLAACRKDRLFLFVFSADYS